MAGYDVFTSPLSPGERIANILTGIEQRIGDLERTRSAISVSSADPSTAPMPGAMHLNKAQGRFWLYTGTKWVTADSARVYAFTATNISRPGDGVYSTLGPEVTFVVPDSGIYLLYGDAELWVPNGTSSAGVRFEVSGANTWTAGVMGSQTIGWVRRSTSGGGLMNSKGPTFGGPGLGGGWLVNVGTPGSTTARMAFAGGAGGSTVQFQNRHIYAVTL